MKLLKIGAIWCGGCLIMNNVIQKCLKNYTIDYEELDLDMDEEEVKKLNVGNILPEFIFLDSNDSEIKRIIGEKTQDELEKEIEVIKNEI